MSKIQYFGPYPEIDPLKVPIDGMPPLPALTIDGVRPPYYVESSNIKKEFDKYAPGTILRLLEDYKYCNGKMVKKGSIAVSVEASYTRNVKFEGHTAYFSVTKELDDILEFVFLPYEPHISYTPNFWEWIWKIIGGWFNK